MKKELSPYIISIIPFFLYWESDFFQVEKFVVYFSISFVVAGVLFISSRYSLQKITNIDDAVNSIQRIVLFFLHLIVLITEIILGNIILVEII